MDDLKIPEKSVLEAPVTLPLIDRERALAEVVKQIEDEYIELDKRAERLGLNQPTVISVSSVSATAETNTQSYYDQIGYSEFKVRFPFPALKVKSLQLLSANIPQANTNIPNTACVFWYYRLNGYTGLIPNAENLYQIRLLPSYYKQELLNDPTLYGYNQTFKKYADLNTALNLSTAHDPAYDNSVFYQGTQPYNIPFLPNEISFDYNTTTNRFSMTGTNATTEYCYTAYDDRVTSIQGQVVYITGTADTYQAIQASLDTYPPENPLFWKRVYIPIVQEWASNVVYNPNALVVQNGILYQSNNIKNTNQSPDGNWAWDSNYYYCKFQVVLYGSTPTYYTYINNGSTNGALPVGNPFYWTPSTWFSGTTYPKGFNVYRSGFWYYALQTNTGHDPDLEDETNPVYWFLFGNFWAEGVNTTRPSNYYLITGPADPNVALRQGTEQRQYNPYHLYEQNDIVYYNGVKYITGQQNQNAPPFQIPFFVPNYNPAKQYAIGDIVISDTSYYIAVAVPPIASYPTRLSNYWSRQVWTETTLKAPIVSLSTISQTFDFYERQLTFQGTYPVGIPPQPFNPNPQRILNTILGFTFTGNFVPSAYGIITSGTVTELVPNSLLNQYNRLRPIPLYFSTDTPLLTLNPSRVTQTYTADGFCNLVYSSILKIYCNVVFAGTLDSQRSNNLLGVIPFNCGNLGIAFASNYIETKITKIQDEIYEIAIRFEDEFGDPFVVTNNAVSTLLLKLTYKETPA